MRADCQHGRAGLNVILICPSCTEYVCGSCGFGHADRCMFHVALTARLRLSWWWGVQDRAEAWWRRRTWRSRIHLTKPDAPVIVSRRRRPTDLVAVCYGLMIVGFVPIIIVLLRMPGKLNRTDPLTTLIFAVGAGLFTLGAWPLVRFSQRKPE